MRKRANPLAHYENKWVALSPDNRKVVASGTTVKEVDQKLRRLKNKDAVLTKVISFDSFLSP